MMFVKSRKESAKVVNARSSHATICKIGLRFDSVIVILLGASQLEPASSIRAVDGIAKNRWGPKPCVEKADQSMTRQRDGPYINLTESGA